MQIVLYIILGIVITIGFIAFILSQRSNKDENKLILTDVTNQITYNDKNKSMSFNDDFGVYAIPTYIFNDYGNFYLTITENFTRVWIDNKTILINSRINLFVTIPILVNNVVMNHKNYIYLAMQNKIISKNLISLTNNNINYDINIYAIPKNKMIMKVESLLKYSDKSVDTIIYDYEFGPEERVILTLKDRKNNIYISNKFPMLLHPSI
jgi:hypothetical protein